MRAVIKFRRVALGLVLAILFTSSAAFGHSVSVSIHCNDGSVTAYAYASPSWYFGQGEMDLQITGPYTSYSSTSGTGGLYINNSVQFEYDQYYTATACAYFEDDDGNWFGCDTHSCVTPIEGVE